MPYACFAPRAQPTVAVSEGTLPVHIARKLERRGFLLEGLAIPTMLPQRDGGPKHPSPGRIAVLAGAQIPGSVEAAATLLSWIERRYGAFVLVGNTVPEVAALLETHASSWIIPPLQDVAVATALQAAWRAAAWRDELRETREQLALKEAEASSLYEVGAALSAEHDIGRLQDLILRRCRELTGADAGSLYIADERVDPQSGAKRRVLRFEISQNDSIPNSYERFEVDVSESSIAGYVALTGHTLNIPDVYHPDGPAPYQFNRSFDESTGYRTKSMLVVPLRNHDGDIVGVIQLINRKRSFQTRLATSGDFEREVLPFPAASEQVLDAFAGQAASALNNRLLLDSIERLFEGFVTASVKAIEARDPTTSGHSARVATLTVAIASAINDIAVGKWRDVHLNEHEIRQIRYAAMLHDFGKIGVREHVLLKARKLTEEQLGVVRLRFAFVHKAVESQYWRRQLDVLMRCGAERYREQLAHLDEEYRRQVRTLDRDLAAIVAANEPTVLEADHADQLAQIAARRYLDGEGVERPLLEPAEVRALSVRRGSLTETERRHIESHVQQTYDFLSLMPWTRQLQDVPAIAWAHHEKLDGTGYPRGLQAAEIPLASRMMAIADIYDALTAADRPYKPAVSTGEAIDILTDEARSGKVDADLLDVFARRRIYELTNPDAVGRLDPLVLEALATR